jgi:excisionase family DNA binding protein
MADDLLSTVEVAALLGISRGGVHHLGEKGYIPYQRIDGRRYFKRADVEAHRPRLGPSAGRPRTDGPLPRSAPRVLGCLNEWAASTSEQLAMVVELHPGNVRKCLAIAEKLGYTVRSRTGEGLEWSLTDAGRAWLSTQEVAA